MAKTVEQEVLGKVNLKEEDFPSRSEFLDQVTRVANSLPEKAWSKLSPEAQEWVDNNVEQLNSKEPAVDFPGRDEAPSGGEADASVEEEGEQEAPSSTEEEPAPKPKKERKSKKEPKPKKERKPKKEKPVKDPDDQGESAKHRDLIRELLYDDLDGHANIKFLRDELTKRGVLVKDRVIRTVRRHYNETMKFLQSKGVVEKG